MSRGKILAIITGVISIFLAVAYLILVQVLDLRGEMLPAPTLELLPILVLNLKFILYLFPSLIINNC